jgi:acetyltransferase-like isoleucine patch superfamily enzyme
MNKLFVVFYYGFVQHLPHSRYCSFFNTFRCWYLHKALRIIKSTESTKIEPNVYLGNMKEIIIGTGVRINENVFIQGARVGDKVLIAPNVAILSSSHKYNDVTIPIIDQGEHKKKVPVIGNDVWIGRNSVILPGIKIGDGAVIGACSLVNKDVNPYTVVAGVPARFIKFRKN